MGCISSSCKSLWYCCTDKFYKIENVTETELISSCPTCSYPFCYTIASIGINSDRTFIRFRNRLYCSRACLNSHKSIGFSNAGYANAEYADL